MSIVQNFFVTAVSRYNFLLSHKPILIVRS